VQFLYASVDKCVGILLDSLHTICYSLGIGFIFSNLPRYKCNFHVSSNTTFQDLLTFLLVSFLCWRYEEEILFGTLSGKQ
jgi:hypothetical protein